MGCVLNDVGNPVIYLFVFVLQLFLKLNKLSHKLAVAYEHTYIHTNQLAKIYKK